jgi:glycosyltransferase involved in cell wall biosynthesis
MVTLHDIIPYLYKTGKASVGNNPMYTIKHFFYIVLLKNTMRNARAIITPTETVKKEIGAAFGTQYLKKIYPIYEGIDSNLMNAEENKKLTPDFSFPFFIYVGNFYPHKNVESLVKAFQHISNPTKLILLGPSDFFYARIQKLIDALQCRQKIIFFPNPSDRDLVFFYKHAKALIHPSFAEGFGLPLLEAAYFNCPIIASDIPVFNEILDGQFIKFNPHDYTNIQNKIEQHIAHPRVSHHKTIVKRFSFQKMAQETFFIYQTCS